MKLIYTKNTNDRSKALKQHIFNEKITFSPYDRKNLEVQVLDECAETKNSKIHSEM